MRKFLAESALVCAGGALGACVRWAVADMLAPGFVFAIFLCNVLGSFLFALYVDFERISRPKIKKFHTVGICRRAYDFFDVFPPSCGTRFPGAFLRGMPSFFWHVCGVPCGGAT